VQLSAVLHLPAEDWPAIADSMQDSKGMRRI
jgi:hypothetical protein